MRRTFADLHLKTNNTEPTQLGKLAQKAAELGYKMVAASIPPTTSIQEIQNLKASYSDMGLDFVSRVDIYPKSQNDLLNALRKLRRRFEVLSVLCDTKDIARQAAKDHRVDLISFPSLDYRNRFFDRAEAELASTGSAAFEVDTRPVLILEGPQRVRFLSTLRREISVALEFHLPIVVSSGTNEPLTMRKPKETAILTSLFGLTGSEALNAVSTNPVNIVKHNREKLGENFVAPGIRIIKKGKSP